MLTPFVLFFGLTVATAVIAYWSDNLGKKLGKKRISLLGMRPRTTATVLTVASSWGIMLFTLVVMLIVAKPLRDALFRFDRERAQNQELRAQRDQLVLQKEDIENALDDRQNRLNRVEKQAVQAEKNVQIQTVNARQAQGAARKALREQRLAVQRESIARRGERNAKSSEKLAKRGAESAAKRAETARQGEIAAKAQATLASANLGQVQSQLRQNNQRLLQARDELSQTNDELEQAQTRFRNAQQRLDVARGELKRVKNEALKAGNQARAAFDAAAAAQRELKSAQEQVDALKQQQSELEQRISGLGTYTNSLYATVRQLATRPVLVTFNQTLVARTLPPSLSPARVESHLRSLFRVAQEVGPRLLPNSKVELFQDVEVPDGKVPAKLPDDQVFARAADFIAASGREVSVRLVSLSNFAEGESSLLVRFQVVEVKKAVDAGDMLAQKSIDGKIGDSAIFTALLELVETGRREAVRRGINPPQSPDDPNFYENGTNEQIFDALRRIQKIGGPTNVKIVAAEDLSTVEPVRVRFEIS